MDGLKSLRGLLLAELVLFSPRLTVVPVRKPFASPKLPMFCRWIRALVPVTKALLCGVVRCAQLKLLVSTGSRLGMDGPDDCTALPPTALELALLDDAVGALGAARRRARAAHRGAVGAGGHVGGDAAREAARFGDLQRGIGDQRRRSAGSRCPGYFRAPARLRPAAKDTGCPRAAGIRCAWNWSDCWAARPRRDRGWSAGRSGRSPLSWAGRVPATPLGRVRRQDAWGRRQQQHAQ